MIEPIAGWLFLALLWISSMFVVVHMIRRVVFRRQMSRRLREIHRAAYQERQQDVIQ